LRPVAVDLYFKFRTEILHASTFQAHALNWLFSWLALLPFSWGLLALVRRLVPIRPGAFWALAGLAFLVPNYLFQTAFGGTDSWTQFALLGLGWGVLFSGSLRWPRMRPEPRMESGVARGVLGCTFFFLACQCYENSVLILGWSTLWLVVGRAWLEHRSPGQSHDLVQGGPPAAVLKILVWLPLAVALVYVGFYRGFSSASTNRTEITVSYDPIHLLGTLRFYVMWGLNAYAYPFADWLGIDLPAWEIGSDPESFPVSFLLCLSALSFGLWRSWREAQRQELRTQWFLTWSLVLGALLLALPYLPMVQRNLNYYSQRSCIWMVAFVVVHFFFGATGTTGNKGTGEAQAAVTASKREVKARERRWVRETATAVLVYALGLWIASSTLIEGNNFMKRYGALSREFHKRVVALPESSSCTPREPCCLEVPGEGWLYNYTTVNVNDGGQFPPRFVRPGKPCARTLRVPALGHY